MHLSRNALFAAAAVTLALLLCPSAAGADNGVVGASRDAAAPGDQVTVRIACGACLAPASPEIPAFPVSLAPLDRAPRPFPCGVRRLCMPATLHPPARAPYALLGRATLVDPRSSPAAAENLPLYSLRFQVPDLRPGAYTYVIFCPACAPGPRGGLIAWPDSLRWRLQVRSW